MRWLRAAAATARAARVVGAAAPACPKRQQRASARRPRRGPSACCSSGAPHLAKLVHRVVRCFGRDDELHQLHRLRPARRQRVPAGALNAAPRAGARLRRGARDEQRHESGALESRDGRAATRRRAVLRRCWRSDARARPAPRRCVRRTGRAPCRRAHRGWAASTCSFFRHDRRKREVLFAARLTASRPRGARAPWATRAGEGQPLRGSPAAVAVRTAAEGTTNERHKGALFLLCRSLPTPSPPPPPLVPRLGGRCACRHACSSSSSSSSSNACWRPRRALPAVATLRRRVHHRTRHKTGEPVTREWVKRARFMLHADA